MKIYSFFTFLKNSFVVLYTPVFCNKGGSCLFEGDFHPTKLNQLNDSCSVNFEKKLNEVTMKKEFPITIAVVDDNALIRESVKFRLNSLGYNVVMEAENGQEFLDKLHV